MASEPSSRCLLESGERKVLKKCRGCELRGREFMKDESAFINSKGRAHRNGFCDDCLEEHNTTRPKSADGKTLLANELSAKLRAVMSSKAGFNTFIPLPRNGKEDNR